MNQNMEIALNYLHVKKGKATIYHKDTNGKFYAISSEDSSIPYYRKTYIKESELTPIYASSVEGIREKYPEEFL